MDVWFVPKSVHNSNNCRFLLAQTPEDVLFAKPREILPCTCALAKRDGDPGERRSETPPYLARASAWCLGSRRRRLCAAGPSRPPPGSPSGRSRSRTRGSCSGAGRRRRRAGRSGSCSLSRALWPSRWRRRCWPCICTGGSSPRSTHRRSARRARPRFYLL